MFDRILASLHDAALNDAHWPTASALIEEACGATGNVLTVGATSGNPVPVHFAWLLYRGEPRDDLAQEYFEVYYDRDEGPRRLGDRPVGEVVHVPDMYTQRELKASPAYNEGWGRRNARNGLIARLDCRDGLNVVWAIADPVGGGGWGSAQVELIESVLPHVRHFVRVRQALAAADALRAGLAGLLDHAQIAALELDRGGRVLAANASALNVLRRGDGLADRGGVLSASLPADNGRLQRLVKRALPVFGSTAPPTGGSMTVQRPLLRSRLELHVHPVGSVRPDFGGPRPAVLVLVVDPESRPRIDAVRVSALLGLTASEGRVAALLAEGRSVREIATTAGYRESYVRWLLKQVYKKQGLSGQVALVQRVLTAYALPRR